MKKRSLLLVNSLLVFSVLIMLWEGVILVFHVPPFMLPDPLKVALAIGARPHDLFSSLLITTEEALGGLLVSVVLGVLISLVLAQSKWIRRMFLPYIVLLQTVPVIAITPLMIMWVGAGTTAVFLVTVIFCLPAIIANTTQGLISVDQNLVQLFLMHNASSWQILRKLRFPHSLPYLFVGMRIASGIAVIGAVTGELFAGSTSIGGGGLGYAIIYASSQLQTDYLFALVLASAALGFAFFFTVMFFEWLFLHHWHESARASQLD